MLARLFGAITATTGIAAIVAILSIWGCWAERDSKNLVWKLNFGMAILGVLGIVFSIKEELSSQDAQAVAQGQITTAQKDAATALKKLAETESRNSELLDLNRAMARRMDSRGDILTPDSRSRLLAELKKLPPNSVHVLRLGDTHEAREFADVLEELMRQAGCLGGTTALDISMNTHAPGRVVVRPIVPEGEAAAVALAKAIDGAGIPDVSLDRSTGPQAIGTTSPVMLTIKPK